MAYEKPQLVFGAVYYRRTNPPQADWACDYAQAAADGMNLFRHWFLWGALEVAPGVFDWSKYDEHMELAAKHGIRVIIAEIQNSPEWLYHKHKNLLHVKADGSSSSGGMGNSTAAGGFTGGLCLDNEEGRRLTANYLTSMAKHYKGHPALYGYDVNNECHYSRGTCYCPASINRFREWLLAKYGSLEALSEAWHRYGYTSWDQVEAPRSHGMHPQSIDWYAFCRHRSYENMQWRVDTIRAADPDARITAHGFMGSVDTYTSGADDWLAASKVESYGFTFVPCRRGNDKWRHWEAVDLARAASRGKDFWHAEMQGGPLWFQPQVTGREPEDGRVATAQDIRMWCMVSLAGGARGLVWTRWRALLDGPLFGAFGLYSDDGAPNDRSNIASSIGKWANEPNNAALMSARPVRGDIGLVVLDEIQDFNHLIPQAGEGRFYAKCAWGAYHAFDSMNIQADKVHFDDIGDYRILYFPYPIHLTKPQAEKLMKWVYDGGTLISEGMPGYFGEGGHVGTLQPNHGMHEMFGATQATAEFMPDLGSRISFDYVSGGVALRGVPGGLFRQSYSAKNAEVLAKYPDGSAAVLRHDYGKGSAILIGTFPSEAYNRKEPESVEKLFKALFDMAGGKQRATVSDRRVAARISEDEKNGRRFVWAVNHAYETAEVTIEVDGGGEVLQILWGNEDSVSGSGIYSAVIPAQDAVVFEIK